MDLYTAPIDKATVISNMPRWASTIPTNGDAPSKPIPQLASEASTLLDDATSIARMLKLCFDFLLDLAQVYEQFL